MGFIPERWLEYKSIGKPVEAVPIVAFKTPLSERYNRSSRPNDDGQFVEKDQEFTPAHLFQKMKDLGFEFAVVIDLTFTFRYYDGVLELCEKRDVQYEKIKCEGQRIPSEKVFKRMADVISDVIYQHGKDGKKLAGIHCTHGVNRTGYLVCRYLIDYLGYQPDDAIKAFNESREHDIERDEYLEALRNRKPQHLYKEWKLNRERFEPHININLEDWNENINSFEQSKERFFSHRVMYDEDRKWSRYNDWDDRHTRRGRGRGRDYMRPRHYRGGRFNNATRLGRWSRWYDGDFVGSQRSNKFDDDYVPSGDGFVCETINNEQFAKVPITNGN